MNGGALSAMEEVDDIAGRSEGRHLEFKRGAAWKTLRCTLTRTIMAMSNLRYGGRIMIGVEEGPDKTAVLVGMSKAESNGYNLDDIMSFVNEYAEPPIGIAMRKAARSERHFVILDVREFRDVPIVCKRDGKRSCSDHLRRGSIYHRPSHRTESTDRFEPADMRELVQLAATKQHRRMHRQCARLYGMPGADLGGAPDARYDREDGGP